MARNVALLRGINVGGNNLIRMADLKACFEAHGYGDVVTYIQSGNVVFTARGSGAALTREVEAMLASTFDHYDASVVIRSRTQLRAIVDRAPGGFGEAPDLFRYDVIFLMPPLTARAAIADVPVREGVDTVTAGPGVLYHSRLTSQATKSRLSKIAALPMYRQLTIRNWNTTTKLLALMDG